MTEDPGPLTAVPHMVNLGSTEILLVLLVLVLLFGAKKLPELARGSGRALRIFKSETKGLLDEDPADTNPAALPVARPTHREDDLPPAVARLHERS